MLGLRQTANWTWVRVGQITKLRDTELGDPDATDYQVVHPAGLHQSTHVSCCQVCPLQIPLSDTKHPR